MGEPGDATRRRVLIGTTAAVATALAGCGSPGESDGEPGFQNQGNDEGSPPAEGEEGNAGGGGQGNASDENDPYAPEGNSTRGSGNRTVSERTPSTDGSDGSQNDSGGGQNGSDGSQNDSGGGQNGS